MSAASTLLHKLRYKKLKEALQGQSHEQSDQDQQQDVKTATEGIHRTILDLEKDLLGRKAQRPRQKAKHTKDPFAVPTFFTRQNTWDFVMPAPASLQQSTLQQFDGSSVCSRFVSNVSDAKPSVVIDEGEAAGRPKVAVSTDKHASQGTSGTNRAQPSLVMKRIRQNDTRGLLRVPASRHRP